MAKADPRIASTVDSVRTYSDRFIDLPLDSIAVLVTHMDNVTWSKDQLRKAIDDNLGIDAVVFSGYNKLSRVIILMATSLTQAHTT